MGTLNRKKTQLEYCILVFVAVYHMFGYVHVDGKPISSIQLAKHKGVLKTIQSDDGDVIDCVDIYKQPAFDHPLLKNHTIQMKPSSYPKGIREEKLEPELFQAWHKNGRCPQGTIPIIRPQKPNSTRTKPLVYPRKKLDKHAIKDAATPVHEHARVSVTDGDYFGASGRLNVWNPATFDGEFSSAQISLSSANGIDGLSIMKAGWQTKSDDQRPRLFIYWTNDLFEDPGCYNFECPGFVQIDSKFSPGTILQPISSYGGTQLEILITIHKDQQTGYWWLRFQNVDVGYWPGSTFTSSFDRAEIITWGGEITDSLSEGRHTSTQMGSGHFPREGFSKASFIRNVGFINESGAVIDAGNVIPFVTNPACYDLQMGNITSYGVHFFYGGPGFSNICP